MATNWLRKRLDEADERTKARVNESFCTVGTPLPSLDSSKRDANEYKPEWQQEVYDDQGRRRFHGAFTGGFSAGYYNTVGSKEGWSPSSFRSSRKEKQKAGKDGGQTANASRNVQDFMDEEDLEDVRQGRGALQSSEAYGGKPREAPIERDPLLGMLGLAQPADSEAAAASSSRAITGKTTDSIGTKMLRQMGWKPGHGLGPRVSAKRRRELEAALGGVEATVDDSDSDKLVAPPDTQLVKPPLRQGSRGLGWDGSDRPATLAEALQRERGTQATSTGPRRSGFGIGALEQDSDGEEEVYAVGHRIEQSTLQAGRRKAKSDAKEQRKTPQTKESLSDDKENKWQDGRPMLAGFRIAQRPLAQERWYAATRPPAGWKPDPQRVWTQAAVATAATKSGASEVNLGPSQRASILGEARIPGPPPMITDYLSLKARERVERSKAAAESDAASAPSAAVSEPGASIQRTIPKLDSATAKAALQGYMPFETELAKQQRYRNYLRSQVEPQLSIEVSPDEGQSVEHFHRELNEFSRSAAIFKPMSTVMASRFESSASGSTHVQPLAPGLYVPDHNAQLEREAASKVADTKSVDEERAQNEWQGLTAVRRNARMGLFGPDTTREVKSWKPARLLCKRFNVAPPYNLDEEESGETAEMAARPADEDQGAFGASFDKRSSGSVVSGGVNARWEASKRQLQHLAASRAWEGHDVDVQRVDEKPVAETKTTGTSNALANVGFGGDDEVREEMTYVKPPLDLFKAIFADDDVDGEQHNGTAAPIAEAVDRQASSPPAEAPRIATHAALPRPTFIPRKRPIVDNVDANTGGERAPGHQTKKAKAKDGRNASKTKRRSLLTFDLDDGDDVDDDSSPHKRSHQQVDTPSGMPRRPRASDLFD